MAYYAIKGGEEAIKNSLDFYGDIASKGERDLMMNDLMEGLTFSIDRVMSEGSLYSKKLASKSYKKKCRRPY